ncbi:MAG: hypothetical protein ACW99F_03645, partial [Candidatus Hodarchaeales archaeon]
MKISQWQHIQQHRSITVFFILFVLMVSSTSHLAFILTVNNPFQDDDVEADSLTNTDGFIDIEKLKGTENTFSYPIQDSSLINQDNRLVSNFAIGSQSGTGGGSVTIRDTFNWTGTIEMSTQNELSGGVPTNQTDSISITNSTVTATADWRLIENLDNTFRTPKDSDPNGDEFYEVAMSFNITEDWVNLTKVRIILDQNLLGTPEGELYIVNSTSGGDPDDTDILSESLTLLRTAVNWDTYTFTDPILLPNGTYFLVMNATVYDSSNYWSWYWQNDLSDDGNEDGIAYYKDFDHGAWTRWDPATLPLQIEVTPVYYNGSEYINKIYQSPDELNFSYNTTEDDTELASFVWFDWNNTNSHTFQTETSVSFNLSFVANYTYALNPISGSTNYLVNNGTLSFWNVSFSTALLNTTYLVRNRTITIQGLSNDWNGSSIYHDNSFVYNETATGGLNNSVLYTNQTSTMIINASTLTDVKDWDVLFIAPNYITSFNWQISNSNITTATTMDILNANYTFISPNIGGFNFSIWIEAPDRTLVNSSVDNTFGTNDLYSWDINQSIHNALLTNKANGTYQTYVFWENTTNNQVGFYTRNLSINIHTTLLVEAPDEVFENTWLNMTVHYNATHIGTGVNNGNVTGLFGWNDTLKSFNQPVAFGLYNLSIWIDGADHSPGDRTNITIYAELPWYQNHSEVWNITVVSTTILSVIDVPANLLLEYGQTYLLQINYLYSGSFLPEANMTVDGDNENYTEETDHYSYLLDTRNYNSGDSYLNLEIRLNRSGYLTQKLTFNLTVTAGPTTLHKAYTPAIPSIYYTESYSFAVLYNNTVDNEGITNANYSTSHSSAINFWYFNSSGYYFFNLSSSSLSLGSFEINITLNHSIYQENFILLTFNIVEMSTQPLDSYSISSNQIMVEETITVTIDEFLTYKSDSIGTIDNASILLNDSSVDLSLVSFSSNAPFSIALDTLGIQYGKYNMTIILSIYGYENQAISFNVSIDGYETEISVEIEPGTNIQQGEDIIFIATLAYVTEGGAGAGVTQQVPLERVSITFYIVLEYENGTTQIYEEIKETDSSTYRATYTIDGIYTRDAIKLTNITIYSSPGLSGLPYTY